MNDRKESDAQKLTWELKDDAWSEVAHLPRLEAFRERRRRAMQTVRELGFEDRVRDPRVLPATKSNKR
jgi:hypothetical protein